MMRLFALCIGILSMLTFFAAVALMAYSLWTGMGQEPDGSLLNACLWDSFLILQFPILHSYFLNGGRQWMKKIMPNAISEKMQFTMYSWFASLQLLLVFGTWQSTGITLYEPSSVVFYICAVCFILSWILLKISMLEAGIFMQTGIVGWWSVWRKAAPRFPTLATRGLHRFSRHPIYVSFALIILSAPTFTLDRIALAAVWTLYCIVGPLWKERRIMSRQPDAYTEYKKTTPYFIPLAFINASKRDRP